MSAILAQELVTVVIPIHREEPSELEKISLAQILAVLHRHPITFMAPYGLTTTWYENFCRGKAQIRIECFQWKGHEAYGMLMASHTFFERFLPYQYVLICHLDAFVFRDELADWCQLGYDYIGSVMYGADWGENTLLRRVTGFTIPEYFGNGGFALKKVSSFYRITSKYHSYINLFHWLRRRQKKEFFDDLFVTQHFPKLSAGFRIPSKELAQKFGAEYKKRTTPPEEKVPFVDADNQTSQLPFGVHGWIQYHQDFWAPYIRSYGHTL